MLVTKPKPPLVTPPTILGGFAICTDPSRDLGKVPIPCEPFSIQLLVSGTGPVNFNDILNHTFEAGLSVGGEDGPAAYGSASQLEFEVTFVEGDAIGKHGGSIFISFEIAEILQALGQTWDKKRWYGFAALDVAQAPQQICCNMQNKLLWHASDKSVDKLFFTIMPAGGAPHLVIGQATHQMTAVEAYQSPKHVPYSCETDDD